MMEYVDGEDLQAYIKRHKGHVPVTRRLLFNFMCSALDALDTLHIKFIAHRDVKPRNFIVTPSTSEDGTPHLTLIDLGLGVRLDERRAAPNDDAGTPAYFSPEMVQALYDDYINSTESSDDDDNMSHIGNVSRGGDEASGRVSREALYAGDVWALGASLYFLLTGEHIAPQYDWESPKLKEVFDAILAFKLPKRKPGTKTVLFHDDLAIDRVICTCLQADPSKRSTAGALLQQLKDEYEESDDEEEDQDEEEDEDEEEEDDGDEEVDEDQLVDVEGGDDEEDNNSTTANISRNERNDTGRNRKRPSVHNGRRGNATLAESEDGLSVRRITRGKTIPAAVILSPAPAGRRKVTAPAEPAAKKRVRATDDKEDPRGYDVAPVPSSPRRSKRRGVVILPTLTPRTLRQRGRRAPADEASTPVRRRRRADDNDDDNEHEAAVDGDDEDDEDEDADDEDAEDNETQASAIEAPALDEDEDQARRMRINERLRARTRQQMAAAAASSSRSHAVSPRRSSRQRPAPAIDGTLSSDDHEPPRRSTTTVRTRATTARANKRRW
jgi:serine/threonine protein kinase